VTKAFDTIWTEMRQRAESVMQAKQIPGAALGLHYRGQEATAGLGTTSIDNPLPVDESTLFQIGSITKTFTTLLLLQLVEAGNLDLDAPLRRYLPAFRVADEGASAEATPRHLLTHMADWVGDHFVDTGPGLDAIERYVASMAELPQLTPLGTHWSYNNASFCVAGRLVEVLTGQPWHLALRDRVLQPLGMSAATEMVDVLTRRYVVGHDRLGGELRVAQPWPLPRCMRPAGGICADIQDMLRYARYQLGDGSTESGGRLLKPETTELMRSRQCAIREPDEEMALGWFRGRAGRDLRWFHGGSTMGQVAYMVVIPARRWAVVVLTNADHGGALVHPLVKAAMDGLLAPERPAESEPTEIPDDLRQALVGRYRRPMETVDLGCVGERLVAAIQTHQGFPAPDCPPPPDPPPMTLRLAAPDRLVVADGDAKGSTWDIVRRDDGSIGWLRHASRLVPRVEA